MLPFLLLLATLLLPNPALAKEDDRLRMVVHFGAADSQQWWQAKALEDSSEKFIAGFQKLQVVTAPKKFLDCQKLHCRVNALHDARISYLWMGELQDQRLQFQIMEIPSRAILSSGTMTLGRTAVASQVQALQAVRPLVRKGGIIDQVFARQQAHRWLVPEALSAIVNLQQFGFWSALLALLGGVAWGYLLLIGGRFVLGTFHGIETIWHWNLFQLVHSWIEVFLAKFFLLLIYLTPSLGLALFLTGKQDAIQQLTWFLIFPTIGLIQIAIFVLLSSLFTLRLDRKKVKDRVKDNDVWNAEISRYLMGYYQRLGLDIPLSIIEPIRFLPGTSLDILTYGGLFTRPRIVIPFQMLDYAIGEPEVATQDKLDRAPVAANESLGLVLPKKRDKVLGGKTSEKALEKAITKSKFYLTPKQAMLYLQDHTQPPMEASAGVWGHIRPQRSGDSVPLISDSLQDLQIVEELLTEHHVKFAKLQFEEDYDDTDPTDLDFLFGILLREIGRVHRREHYILTWAHYLNDWRLGFSDRLAKVYDWCLNFYKDHFSKHPAYLADAYVVLHHGRHHLAQYMYYWMTGRTHLLTHRANRQQLLKVSDTIFDTLRVVPPGDAELKRNRATPLNRIIWLSQFFSSGLPDFPIKKSKPYIPITVGLLAATLLGFKVLEAVEYRQVYDQRIEDVKKQIEDYYKNKEKEDGPGR
ncbi:MAG: hypothetical protein H6624_08035 [Bdellovibrionaceae bacterium]|nr:hypothetical protein [Bdellovibrionales bacterium]MCB9084281.1 hypothetical protein [Pseudobdellovibrionaceae bacterium]